MRPLGQSLPGCEPFNDKLAVASQGASELQLPLGFAHDILYPLRRICEDMLGVLLFAKFARLVNDGLPIDSCSDDLIRGHGHTSRS